MIVDIIIEKDRCRHWLFYLEGSLKRSSSLNVRFVFVRPLPPLPKPVSYLLSFERKTLRHRANCGSDPIDVNCFKTRDEDTEDADWTIDFTVGGVTSAKGRTLRVLYNGAPGEDALCSTLLNSGTPLIEVIDQGEERVIAQGTASLEAAEGLGGAMEAVYSRVCALINRILNGIYDDYPPSVPCNYSPITTKKVAKRALRQSARTAIQSLYKASCYTSHWRVGWRFCKDGVADRQDLKGEEWKVLPSPHDHFYADPFPFEKDGKYYVFFEDLNHATQKGVISVVEVTREGQTSAPRTVLEEDWHLSYPFVFEMGDGIWMIPESSTNREIALYRAIEFPNHWERHCTLLADIEAADATLIDHDGRLWMFTVVRDGVGGYSDMLNIYHADNLVGPWIPHQCNPVLVDDRTARPGGRMFHKNGTLWRPFQNCRGGYGTGLGLATIDELSPSSFRQSIQTVLFPNSHWPGRKFHTLNRTGPLEVIDGCIYHPKSETLAQIARKFYRPGA
ncbi:MAG: hypothetical protein K5905_00715 [Roseibium sp.]|uniref:glucosamine inositolphosphorylceramide transferase family protein n=1 Tax=Roseibium sp. TaxID=1936156 RepID=UPI00260E648D|nr:hypothetical protein [Roseibium sp.]MCV0423969.1 hypothetical protein [Roseibium sp.]